MIQGLNPGRIARSPEGQRIWDAGLAYQRRLEHERIVAANARETWPEYIKRISPNQKRPLSHIIAEVAEAHGMTINDMKCASHALKLSKVRHEAMYRCALETEASLPMIGKAFGGRDHTTVINGIRRHAYRNNLDLPRGMGWGKMKEPKA